MALVRISDITPADALTGTEMLELETSAGQARRTTVQAIADLASLSGVQSIVPGANVTVDATDPANPVVSAAPGGSSTVSVGTQSASYTAVLADQVVQMNSASANTFTVPPNSAVAFPVGHFLEVWQAGAGQTTIVEGAGVTIQRNASSSLRLNGQNAGCSLRKVATDTWRLVGEMEPV